MMTDSRILLLVALIPFLPTTVVHGRGEQPAAGFAPPSGMRLIPGGTNSGSDPDFGDYSLTVADFYMDEHEVTQRLWTEVRTWGLTNGYVDLPEGSGLNGIDHSKGANHPVVLVNWFDCVKWCNARSVQDGREPVYYTDPEFATVYTNGQVATPHVRAAANGFRLPTVDEWEYAARGGARNRRFPWSDTDTIQHSRANYNSDPAYAYDTSDSAGYHPTYNDGIRPFTNPVGSFAPNGFGLYDMAGNVWEWCDGWHPRFPGTIRVFRGGCWHHGARHCRVAPVNGFHPSYAYQNIGFRCVTPVIQ